MPTEEETERISEGEGATVVTVRCQAPAADPFDSQT